MTKLLVGNKDDAKGAKVVDPEQARIHPLPSDHHIKSPSYHPITSPSDHCDSVT